MATHEGPHFFGATSASRQASASSTDPCARDPEIGKAPEIAQAEQGSKTRHPATRFNWRTDFPHTLWRPEEIRSEEFYRDIFVEYLGTLLFIFFALGAVVFTDFKFSGAVGKLGISFAFGLS
ncbi:hypothetical protein KFL_002590170 [Klebsormidium nitens]|uniref:Aquaporin n=1 Tax=Klebsormidium nitens TaxID=105231 RepID=A0A1Y1I902_KLENI|nr:hypothetical protein KFL_002590170 [Klebsormidium nitens]|eukprot:GAQ85889.1 hypothetical protein KFL_002590170 [Klebsormidium nitens]